MLKREPPMITMVARLPPQLKEGLDETADDKGMSTAELIRYVLRRYVEDHKRNLRARKSS